MHLKLALRRLVGMVTRPYYATYSTCGRCRRPWPVCKEHDTVYEFVYGNMPVNACFPLCQACWSELSIADRLPYYRDLFAKWVIHTPSDNGRPWVETWRMIEDAVMAGR